MTVDDIRVLALRLDGYGHDLHVRQCIAADIVRWADGKSFRFRTELDPEIEPGAVPSPLTGSVFAELDRVIKEAPMSKYKFNNLHARLMRLRTASRGRGDAPTATEAGTTEIAQPHVDRSVPIEPDVFGGAWARDPTLGLVHHASRRLPDRDVWILHPDLGWGRVFAATDAHFGARFSARTAWFPFGDLVVSTWPTMTSPKKTRAEKRRASDGRARRANPPLREAMFWMLHGVGASYANIARAAGRSTERVRQMCREYDARLQCRIVDAGDDEDDLLVRRLRRAGALLTPVPIPFASEAPRTR